jgi:hypothetical protein
MDRIENNNYCCRGMFNNLLQWVANTVVLLRALPGNGRCLQSHCLAVGPYTTMLPPYRLTAISSMLLMSVIGLTFLWLGFHGGFSPTAPFLRPLTPSCSLIGSQSVQVFHHLPPSAWAELSRVAGVSTSLALTPFAVSSFVSEDTDPSTVSWRSFSAV